MNGYVGDHQQIALHADGFGDQTVTLLDHDLAGDGKGTVKPGGAEHTAISLGIQTDISGRGHLGLILDFECGRIAVAGSHHERGRLTFGNTEGNDGGEITADKVAATAFQIPLLALAKFGVAAVGEHRFERFGHMIGADAFFNKVKHCADRGFDISHDLSGSFLVFHFFHYIIFSEIVNKMFRYSRFLLLVRRISTAR